MARLFANKFNLDTLPNPVPPKAVIEQGIADRVQQRIVPQQQQVPPTKRIPPNTVTLADRLMQPTLTTGEKRLLENIGKVSLVNPIRVDTTIIMFKQGVIENVYSAQLSSYITVNQNFYRDLNINQGSVVVQKNIRSVNQGTVVSNAQETVSLIQIVPPKKFVNQGTVTIVKKKVDIPMRSPVQVDSLLDWAGRYRRSFIVDPEIKVKVVDQGDQTINPNIQIIRADDQTFIVNPDTQITLPKTSVLTDPEIKVIPVTNDEFIVDPKIVVNKTIEETFITIPTTVNTSRDTEPTGVTIPQYTFSLDIIPDEFITIPRRNFPLFDNINVSLQGPDITPIKTLVITKPEERHGVLSSIILFQQFDNKIDSATTPRYYLFNRNAIFPSNSPVQEPLIGIVYDPLAIFPSNSPVQEPLRGVIYNQLSIFPSETKPFESTPFTIEGSDPSLIFPSSGDQPLYGNLPYNEYAPDSRYSKENNGGDNSNLKYAIETGFLVERSPSVGATIVVEKQLGRDWIATNNEVTDPGGYKTLTYQQIRRKAGSRDEAKKDFTVELGLNKNPIENWSVRLGMPENDQDTINKSVNATAADLVRVRIESNRGVDKSTLQFRSFLTAFNDTFTTQYTDVNYIGRPDTMRVFKGTQRAVSIAFKVPVMTSKELIIVYKKLEELIKITTIGMLPTNTNSYLDAPFVKLTVGGWLKNTPITVNSLKFDTNPTEYSWDITYEVPQIVDISLDCTVLSDNTAKGMTTNGNYIDTGK